MHRPPSAVFFSHETPTDGFFRTTKKVNPETLDVNEPDEKAWKSEIGKYLQGMIVANKKKYKIVMVCTWSFT